MIIYNTLGKMLPNVFRLTFRGEFGFGSRKEQNNTAFYIIVYCRFLRINQVVSVYQDKRYQRELELENEERLRLRHYRQEILPQCLRKLLKVPHKPNVLEPFLPLYFGMKVFTLHTY